MENENKPLEGEVVETKQPPATEQIAQTLLDPSKNKNGIFIGTLNLMATPVKALTKPLHRHYHRKYHGKYKHAKKIFILDLALIGAAIALLAISLYYFILVQPKQNYLNISLENPQIKIGELQNFNFLINNLRDQALIDVQLFFEFPKFFALKKVPEQFDIKNNSLTIGLLKEKEVAELTFTGQAWGAINEKQRVLVKSRFKDLKNNTFTEEINLVELQLTDSVLKVDFSAPTSIKVGQNLNIVINYQNTSLEPIAKIVLLPNLPKDFEITATTADWRDGRFILKNIPPGKNGQIILSGFLHSMPEKERVSLTLQSFVENEQQQFLQNTNLKTLLVIPNGLDLFFKNLNNRNFVAPGENVTLEINYKNSNNAALKDVVIVLPLAKTITENNLLQITLNKKNTPALASIGPGETGAVNLNFPISSNLGTGEALEKNFTLELRPLATFYLENEPQNLLRSFALAQYYKISTFLQLHAEARYFTEEGDQLGRGPLPPKIGQTTKYWINWFITSTPNAIKNVKIIGHLPTGVIWTGRTNVTEGEPVQYDPVTRAATWENNFIEATPGNRCPCTGIGFEIAVTPTPNDLGKILSLVNGLKITAADFYTNETLEKTASDITTSLINDSHAQGKERARE